MLALLRTQSSAPANEVMPRGTFQNPLNEIQENQEPDEETQHHVQALKVACETGHVAAAYFVSKAYGLDFGSAELTDVKQNLLTYSTQLSARLVDAHNCTGALLNVHLRCSK